MTQPERILLACTNNLGDSVAFLPVAAAVRKGFPQGRITLLAQPPGADVAALTGAVDEFITVPGGPVRGRKLPALAREVRSRRFDLAFMASGESSATSALLFLGGVKRRIGFDDCRLRFLLTQRVQATEEENEAHRNARLLPAAGLPLEVTRPPCRISNEMRAVARAQLEKAGVKPGRRVMIHPGASSVSGRWPAAKFAEICARLVRDGLAQPILLEGPAEPGLAREIRGLSDPSVPVLSDLPNVQTLAAVMAECDLFLGGSSGPTHVAFLVGLPSVSLMGHTNPRLWGPAWEAERHLIIQTPRPCAGCEHWDPRNHVIIRNHVAGGEPCKDCLAAIPEDDAYRAIELQLARNPGRGIERPTS
jgi:ADP-heptose:LPS heptosyltransferase